MDVYYVTYYRSEAKVTDMRVFKSLQELEDWFWRTKKVNEETILILDIIADRRCVDKT